MSDRVTISRELLRSALEDAIGWTEELICGGNDALENTRRLAAYRKTLSRIGGRPSGPPTRSVSLPEVTPRSEMKLPGSSTPDHQPEEG